ncbi:MAG: hypothetical protein CO096_27780 [Armatimonadetes bacterium CG_4_9_14_3_um_filter_66_14]|nr:MAG: hypothetical protein CO096_27780 [Armatimonadetes bacterium CG_4_9_14_3_um_filter_66_14]
MIPLRSNCCGAAISDARTAPTRSIEDSSHRCAPSRIAASCGSGARRSTSRIASLVSGESNGPSISSNSYAPANSPRSRLKTCTQVRSAAATILQQTQAERWITVEVNSIEEHRFTQAKQGRPGKNTKYVRRSFQPTLEKRHEQFKSVLDAMPVLLKSHTRIEAFLLILSKSFPIGVLLCCLAERP